MSNETNERHDRMTIAVQVTANKPLTKKQWRTIHERLSVVFEDCISKSQKLTEQIGHVHIDSPFDDVPAREICP